MKKILFLSIPILIITLIFISIFFLFTKQTEAGAPTQIFIQYLTIYEIGSSHTPGEDRTGGTQKCQSGTTGQLEADCPVGTPCTCDAQVQEGYYYRIEFEISNKPGSAADDMWGYYDSIEELNGTVDTANDIWVVDGGVGETCTASTWDGTRLTWVETDTGCILNLGSGEVGQMMFIIQIGSGASDTSGGLLHGEEDTSGDFLRAGVEITIAAAATISCSTAISSTAFGTLSSDSITDSSPNASTTMSCSGTASGCILYVKDAGDTSNPGLATSSPAYLIPSPDAAYSASTTLSAGTEGYGIQATTTAAGLTIALRYLLTGDDAGGLTLTNQIIASSSADISGAEVIVTHKAAISQTTPIGQYEDTITYECVIN